jgi:hypothetical protein
LSIGRLSGYKEYQAKARFTASSVLAKGPGFLNPINCPEIKNPMTEKSYSKFQQNVIRRYYDNRDAIALQRAQELVTELYLTEGKKRLKVWESLAKNLEKAGIPADQVAHLRQQDNPEMVAKRLSQLV